jgi:hypothetical protein
MLTLGLLLGWINSLCDLSTGMSVTRVLILAITIFETGVRFEGAIAGEYEIWVRSVAGILVLHALLARRGLRHTGQSSAGAAAPEQPTQINARGAFPNLMS